MKIIEKEAGVGPYKKHWIKLYRLDTSKATRYLKATISFVISIRHEIKNIGLGVIYY